MPPLPEAIRAPLMLMLQAVRGQVVAYQLYREHRAPQMMSGLILPLAGMCCHQHVGLWTKGTRCTTRAAFRLWSSSAELPYPHACVIIEK